MHMPAGAHTPKKTPDEMICKVSVTQRGAPNYHYRHEDMRCGDLISQPPRRAWWVRGDKSEQMRIPPWSPDTGGDVEESSPQRQLEEPGVAEGRNDAS
ncbi:hypothetical protein EYF80_032638 [Liparis tanakae]|uniref:Uncharacterized protein n=1 Tax=Liparis tanakae TaxID=230148 RepID=A0A4Z2GVL5_9TELE|nr:hypothetical protein EYF80_032638 [Liparis tanakae]